MYRLTINQTGAEEIRTMMNRLLLFASDISPAAPMLEAVFREIEAEAFAREQAKGQSGAWPQLNPQYRAWKEVHFPGRKILTRTGRLRDSLAGRTADSVVEVSPRRVVFGSDVPYGHYHQVKVQGRKWRPPISLTDAQAARFQSVLQRYYAAEINRLSPSRVSVRRALVGA